jgi:hypothetical protein
MRRFLLALTAFAVLGLASQARAGCWWSGTQVECDLGGQWLTVGAQRAEPECGGTFRLLLLQEGCDGLPVDRAAPEGSFGLKLQNVGVDPGLCRRIGNETYCY